VIRTEGSIEDTMMLFAIGAIFSLLWCSSKVRTWLDLLSL